MRLMTSRRVTWFFPFGFCGSPGYFCMIADAIQDVRRSYGPSNFLINGDIPYAAELFFDDAMFAEPRLGTRQGVNAGRWGRSRVGLLGLGSLIVGKIGLECFRPQEQIAMGFCIDTANYTISLRASKVGGRKIIHYWPYLCT